MTEGVEEFPDGSVYFREADKNGVNLRVQINDMVVNEYHNNNGLTKTTYRLSELMKKKSEENNPYRKNLKNQDATWPVAAVEAGSHRD